MSLLRKATLVASLMVGGRLWGLVSCHHYVPRFVHYEVDPGGLALIARWLAKYRSYWPTRIEALKVLLKGMDQ